MLCIPNAARDVGFITRSFCEPLAVRPRAPRYRILASMAPEASRPAAHKIRKLFIPRPKRRQQTVRCRLFEAQRFGVSWLPMLTHGATCRRLFEAKT